jgi:2,3-bisphosphoglycerate-independent phosphoglycerate mutase
MSQIRARRRNTPLLLAILDGWGVRAETRYNAIALARTPNMDAFYRRYASMTLQASAEGVGLPPGQMGNSEVGHLNIGAGRIVEMDITRIDKSLADGTFYRNAVLVEAIGSARAARCHLVGLVSDGGVHSHENHIYGLLELARRLEARQVYVHALLDGRDTPPTSGAGYVAKLLDVMREKGVGRVATVCGRYYAMDRDKRWERVRRAYEALVAASPATTYDPVAAIRESYARGVTDEFVDPVTVLGADGSPLATVRDGDALLFFNFRADRMREIVAAFTVPDFRGFERRLFPRTRVFTFTEYEANFHLPVAFPPRHFTNILGELLGRAGLSNLRIAETEKYAHVTYFFNGGEEAEFPGERRILVPSPKVATYDLQPEMSAPEVTDRLLLELDKGDLDVVIVNYANTDMVGHSGRLEPTIRAVETVDACLGRIAARVLADGGTLVITADHGNAELMFDEERNEPHTAHTTNPVPFLLVNDAYGGGLRAGGTLEDIAPTLLELLDLPAPKEMTGSSLLLAGAPAGRAAG